MKYKFPRMLHPTEASDGLGGSRWAVGFLDEPSGIVISDTSQSSCGRFPANAEGYGLTYENGEVLTLLNELVTKATEDAINALCLAVQQPLGIAAGNLAAQFFSGHILLDDIQRVTAEYICAEFNWKHP